MRASDFRNYQTLKLDLDARPVVLTGPNGAGKTNILEAVSLLTPGRGLGRAQFGDMLRRGAATGWAVNARLHCASGEIDIGTGFANSHEATSRSVRIDGETRRGTGALGEYVRSVWLTPAMDGMFTGPAGDRRRFLDRLIQSFEPGYRSLVSRFERAMRQRNRLLENGGTPHARLDSLETQMAETGVAIAAARLDTVARLGQAAGRSDKANPASPFPWATLAVEGFLEDRLHSQAAVDAEDAYREALARGRMRDRAARRTLEGPHRSDFLVGHGPKSAAA
ncbi:MAG: DNA replication/repair protein RecF, partial [Methyloligellaceae bacterium]